MTPEWERWFAWRPVANVWDWGRYGTSKNIYRIVWLRFVRRKKLGNGSFKHMMGTE